MLQLAVVDFVFLAPFITILFFSTISYFKFNTTTSLIKTTTKDKKTIKTHISKKNYNFIFLRYIIVLYTILCFNYFLYHGYSGSFWCGHLIINEFLYKYIATFLKIATFCIVLIYTLAVSRVYFSIDYVFSITTIMIVAPLLFFSGNFFTFYFLLELIVCLTFFKFVVSRFWYKSSLQFYTRAGIEKYSDYTPKMFVNALFFQYWVSFFSSIMLLYFFITIEFYFGSTEWVFINFAVAFIDLPSTFYLYFFFFITAFFLKLGITPLHLYKVEVYKGLPYISLYLYTVIFFFIYLFYFVLMFIIYFHAFANYFLISFFVCIILGAVYVTSMLFDVNFLKSFFAYSTIINSLSFLLILLSVF